MPFTFAHPAAILPLVKLRKGADWTEALVVGALVPDLLRPISMLGRELTHSLPGWLLLDTPVGLLLAWLVHRFLTPRLRRLPGLDNLPATPGTFRIGSSLLAVGLGGLSHLAWDLFTHDQSPLLRGPVFERTLFETPAGPFQLGQTLWFANSALGMLAVGIWTMWTIHRSSRGVAALLTGPWLRLVFLSALPFSLVVAGFRPISDNPAKDLFLHVFYLTGELPQILLACSALVFLSLFWWETRSASH